MPNQTDEQIDQIFTDWVVSKGRLFKPTTANSQLLMSKVQAKHDRGEDLTLQDFEDAFNAAEEEGSLEHWEITIEQAKKRIKEEEDRVKKRNDDLAKKDADENFVVTSDGKTVRRHQSESEKTRKDAEFAAEKLKTYMAQSKRVWAASLKAANSSSEYENVLVLIRTQTQDSPYISHAQTEEWIRNNAPGFEASRRASATDAANSLRLILDPIKVSGATLETQKTVKKWYRETSNQMISLVRKNNPTLIQKAEQVISKNFAEDL